MNYDTALFNLAAADISFLFDKIKPNTTFELEDIIPEREQQDFYMDQLKNANPRVIRDGNFTIVTFAKDGYSVSGATKRNPGADPEDRPERAVRLATIRAYRNLVSKGWV